MRWLQLLTAAGSTIIKNDIFDIDVAMKIDIQRQRRIRYRPAAVLDALQQRTSSLSPKG
jgi:hypothetical protein